MSSKLTRHVFEAVKKNYKNNVHELLDTKGHKS